MSSQNESTTNEDPVSHPKPENESTSLEVLQNTQLNPKPSPNPEKILDRENKIVKNIICFFQKDQKDDKIASLKIKKNNKKPLFLPFIQMIQKSNINDKRKEILEKLKNGIEKSTFPKRFTFRKWKTQKIKKDERSHRINIKLNSNSIKQFDKIHQIYREKYIKTLNLDNTSKKLNLNHLSESSNSNLGKINNNYIRKVIKCIKPDLPNKNKNQNLLNINNQLKSNLSNIYNEFRKKNVFSLNQDKEKETKIKLFPSNQNALVLINKKFTDQYINNFKPDNRSKKLEIDFNEESHLEPIYREFSSKTIMPITPASPNKILSRAPFQKRNSLDDIFYEYTKQIHSSDPSNKLGKITFTDMDKIVFSSLTRRLLMKKILYITFSSSQTIITKETIVKILKLIDIDYYEFFIRYVLKKRIGFITDKPSSKINEKYFTKKVLPCTNFVKLFTIPEMIKDNKSEKLNCFKEKFRLDMNFIDIISNSEDLRSIPLPINYFHNRKNENKLDKIFNQYLDFEEKKYNDISFSNKDKISNSDIVAQSDECQVLNPSTIEVIFPETGRTVKIKQETFDKISNFGKLDIKPEAMEKDISFKEEISKQSKIKDNEKSQLLNLVMKSIVNQKKQLTEIFNRYREKLNLKKDEHKNQNNFETFSPEREGDKPKKIYFSNHRNHRKGNLNKLDSMVRIINHIQNQNLEESEYDKLSNKFLLYNNNNQLDKLFQKYQNRQKIKIIRENEDNKPKKIDFNEQKKGKLSKLDSIIQIVNNIQKKNVNEQTCDKLSDKYFVNKRNNDLNELFLKYQNKYKVSINIEKQEDKSKKLIIIKNDNKTYQMNNIHLYYQILDKFNAKNYRSKRILNRNFSNYRDNQLQKIFDEYITQNNKNELENLNNISISEIKSYPSIEQHKQNDDSSNNVHKIKVIFSDGRIETISKEVYDKILNIARIKENEIEVENMKFEKEKNNDLNSARYSDCSFQTCDNIKKTKKYDNLSIDNRPRVEYTITVIKDSPKNDGSILSSSDNVYDRTENDKSRIQEPKPKQDFKERMRTFGIRGKKKIFNSQRAEPQK